MRPDRQNFHRSFLSGLDRDPTSGDDSLGAELPALVVRRYEEYFRRLAAEVPEFAAWAYPAEHETTRAALGDLGGELGARLDALTTGLAGIPALLDQVAGRAAANRVRADLEHAYEAALTRTVLGDTRAPDGVVLPSLPLILLDGFDELLQATGRNRFSYLEEVARSQRRESDLRRPVAAIPSASLVAGCSFHTHGCCWNCGSRHSQHMARRSASGSTACASRR